MWPGLRPRREVAPLKGLGFFYGAFPALTRWANEFSRCAAGAEVTSRHIRFVAFFRAWRSLWILIRSLCPAQWSPCCQPLRDWERRHASRLRIMLLQIFSECADSDPQSRRAPEARRPTAILPRAG